MIGRKGGTKVYDFKYNVLMKCLTAYKRSADDKNANWKYTSHNIVALLHLLALNVPDERYSRNAPYVLSIYDKRWKWDKLGFQSLWLDLPIIMSFVEGYKEAWAVMSVMV